MHFQKNGEDAVARALWLRKKLGIPRTDAVCPVDIAEALGIEVRFVDLPSMEGMYISGASPMIFLSSLRPQGRRNFTCAHEIGHHLFGHGQKFDALVHDRMGERKAKDPDEYVADTFAANLLMPRTAIESGMRLRELDKSALQPIDVYKLSNWLGVGYKTLVQHLKFGLRFISGDAADALLRTTPQDVRYQLGGNEAGNVHCVDPAWRGRAIDCDVGDLIEAPAGVVTEGLVFQAVTKSSTNSLLRTIQAGIGRLTISDWSAYVRVSGARYTGRACYRHEEAIEQ